MTNKEAIKILGNISVDYTGMTQDEINQMDEALTLAIASLDVVGVMDNELSLASRQIEASDQRIKELKKELEESRAKEGKGCLETMVESFGQLALSVNEALKGMTPEEIKELLRPDEEEGDQ